ncbi:PAS domain S-box protein [Accumulibacter sp.]|uniref:PAS domain S-box protein n=1 Tax=Accumulibacter sp. TaxID=2053492 RepID=UPI00258A0169|nr:PAS domain S-box protein [Accumulibacter sp.]
MPLFCEWRRFQAAHRMHVGKFAASPVTSRPMGSTYQVLGRRGNGEEFPLEASISQVEVDGQKLFTASLRDTTERCQTEAALRASEAFNAAILDSPRGPAAPSGSRPACRGRPRGPAAAPQWRARAWRRRCSKSSRAGCDRRPANEGLQAAALAGDSSPVAAACHMLRGNRIARVLP